MNTEIVTLLENSLTLEHDLRAPSVRAVGESLTSFAWEMATRPAGDSVHLPEELVTEALDSSRSFPYLHARVYEAARLASIRDKAHEQTRASALDDFSEELRAERFDPKTPLRSNLILSGCSAYGRNSNTASYLFLKAHQEKISKSVISKFLSYSRSYCPPLEHGIVEKIGKDRPTFRSHSVEAGFDTAIVVSANSAYVYKYLLRYLKSLRDVNYKGRFHLHWIQEPKEAFEGAAQSSIDKARAYLGHRFTVTSEVCPDVFDRRSYFASARFRSARRVLADVERVIITDIDYYAKSSVEKFVDQCNEFDVSLQIRDAGLQAIFPWLKVTAGTVVVRSSSFGALFLDCYEKIFNQLFMPDGYNWGIDQNILGVLCDAFYGLGVVGNSRHFASPFSVPYEIKKQGNQLPVPIDPVPREDRL